MISKSHFPDFSQQCLVLFVLAIVVCFCAFRHLPVVPVIISVITGAIAGVLVGLHHVLPNGIREIPDWFRLLHDYAQRPVPLKGPSDESVAWLVLGHGSFHAGIGIVCGILLLAGVMLTKRLRVQWCPATDRSTRNRRSGV